MAEQGDALVLETSPSEGCRFDSCCPHKKKFNRACGVNRLAYKIWDFVESFKSNMLDRNWSVGEVGYHTCLSRRSFTGSSPVLTAKYFGPLAQFG